MSTPSLISSITATPHALESECCTACLDTHCLSPVHNQIEFVCQITEMENNIFGVGSRRL